MRRRSLAVVGLVVILAGIVGAWQFPSVRHRVFTQWKARTTLSPTVPEGGVVASGLIEAEEVLVSTELTGQVQALYADDGDAVSAGERLIELDATLLDVGVQQARAALQGVQANLTEVMAGARPEAVEIARASVVAAEEGLASADKAVKMARENVAAAQAALQTAEAEMAKLRAEPEQYEVELAETRLELIRDQLEVAWSVRDSVGGSQQRGEVPEGSYEAAQAGVAQAKIQVRIAELQLAELKAGSHLQDLEIAQDTVEVAQAGVAAAEAQVVQAEEQREAARAHLQEAQARLVLVEAGATPEEIAIVQARVKEAEAALQVAQIQRKGATVRAPQAGIVLERPIHLGELVSSGSVLFRLADLDRVYLTVYVPLTDLGKVQIGRNVSVTVDALPGETFQGTVVHISSQAEFLPRQSQTQGEQGSQVFAVRIRLPNPDHELKPGMSADALFEG